MTPQQPFFNLRGLPAIFGALTILAHAAKGAGAHNAFSAAFDFGPVTSVANVSIPLDGATFEAGEPHAVSLHGSTWARWQAPGDGFAVVSFTPYDLTGAGVYTGNSPSTLTEILWRPRTGTGASPLSFSFPAISRQYYHFGMVGRTAGTSPDTSVRLRWIPADPATADGRPPNDAFATPLDLGSSPVFCLTGSTLAATVEPGEPGASPGDRSVWFRWTAPAAGYLQLTPSDTRQVVYTGAAIETLAQRSLLLPGTPPLAISPNRVRVAAAEVYHIAARESDLGTTSKFQPASFLLACRLEGPAPDYDDFSSAALLPAGAVPQPLIMELRDCGVEQGEPPLRTGDDLGAWVRWTVPATGGYRIGATSSDFISSAPACDVFRGADLATLTKQTPYGNTGSTSPSVYHFTAGTEVRIRVTGQRAMLLTASPGAPASAAGRRGGVTVKVEPLAPAGAHDQFAQAMDIADGTGPGIASDLGFSTAEAGESLPPNETSVWYRWTPSVAGQHDIITESPQMAAPVVTVWRGGGSISSLARLTAAEGMGTAWEGPLEAGRFTRVTVPSTDPLFLQVHGHEITGSLRFSLRIQSAPWPRRPEDKVAGRIHLTDAAPLQAAVRFAGALDFLSPGSFLNEFGGLPVVFYSWTAPAAGTWDVRLNDADSSTHRLALTKLNGNRLARQTANVHPASSTGHSARSVVTLDAGETVLCAAVARRTTAQWEPEAAATLSILSVARPAHDDWAQAADAGSALSYSIPLEINGATLEAGEPNNFSSTSYFRSVWMRWTAPSSGMWELKVPGHADLRPEVFTGNSLATLARHAPATSSSNFYFRFESGITYYFRVASFTPRPATVLTLNPDNRYQRPANDDLANAEVLPPGWSHDISVPALPASWEPFEGRSDSFAGSVWYRWTAPADGTLLVLSLYVVMEIFPANQSPPTDPINAAMRAAESGESDFSKSVPVDGGQSYLLRLNCPHAQTAPFPVTLRQQLAGIPPNDRRAAATLIQGGATGAPFIVINGTLHGATKDFSGSEFSSYGADVWYRWQAPQTGHCLIGARHAAPGADLPSGHFNCAGECYASGSTTALSSFEIPGETFIPVTAGEFYDIRIAGPNAGESNEFTLTCGMLAPASNDTPATALPVADAAWTAAASMAAATTSPGDPRYDGLSPNIWFSWTAPASGAWQISVRSSPASWVETGIYSGSPGNLSEELFLSEFGESEDYLEPLSERRRGTGHGYFHATQGTGYYIMARSPRFASGGTALTPACRIRLLPAAIPGNDAFSSATDLGNSEAVSITGTVRGATFEPGEPPATSYPYRPPPGVWYRWTAQGSGDWSISASAGCDSLPVEVFTGTSLADLQPVACDGSNFFASGGASFFIRLTPGPQSAGASGADFVLDIHRAAAAPRVLSVQLSTNQIDLARGDPWLTMLVELDTPSGLHGGQVQFRNKTLQRTCGGIFFGAAGNAASQRIAGDDRRGTYRFVIPIAPASVPDEYLAHLTLELPDHTGTLPASAWPGGTAPAVNVTGTLSRGLRNSVELTVLPGPLPENYAGPLTLRATITTPQSMFSGGRIEILADHATGNPVSIELTSAHRVSGTPWDGAYEVVFQPPPGRLDRHTSFHLLLQSPESPANFRMVDSFGLYESFPGAYFSDFAGPLVFAPVGSHRTVDVSNGPATFVWTARVMDKESGVRDGAVTLTGLSRRGSSITQVCSRIGGTAADGTWRATVTIPAGTPPDIYYVQPRFVDARGNLYFNVTGECDSLHILNSTAFDQSAPAMQALEIAPVTVDISAGPATADAAIHATDDLSGVVSGRITLSDDFGTPLASAAFDSAQLAAGDGRSGTWLIPLTLPQNPDAISGRTGALVILTDASGKTLSWDLPRDAPAGFQLTLPTLVNGSAGPYQRWLAGQPGLSVATAHPLSDADANGIPNLLEMAVAPGSLELRSTPAGVELHGTISSHLLSGSDGVSLATQTSLDLTTWLPPVPVVPDVNGRFKAVLSQSPGPPKAYVRLRAAFIP